MANPYKPLTLGDRVRLCRTHLGVTAGQLAEDTEVTRGTIHNIESGRHSPRSDLLLILSRALFVSPYYLLCKEYFPPHKLDVLEGEATKMKQKRYTVMVGIEPGNWTLEQREYDTIFSVTIKCPRRKGGPRNGKCDSLLATVLTSQVFDDGRVTPRLRCPSCDMYEFVLLKDWKPFVETDIPPNPDPLEH